MNRDDIAAAAETVRLSTDTYLSTSPAQLYHQSSTVAPCTCACMFSHVYEFIVAYLADSLLHRQEYDDVSNRVTPARACRSPRLLASRLVGATKIQSSGSALSQRSRTCPRQSACCRGSFCSRCCCCCSMHSARKFSNDRSVGLSRTTASSRITATLAAYTSCASSPSW